MALSGAVVEALPFCPRCNSFLSREQHHDHVLRGCPKSRYSKVGCACARNVVYRVPDEARLTRWSK